MATETTEPSTPESSDDHQGPSQGQVRSYECTFCKGGFSNAQALGGHMNIHRKDKAKLKQLASTDHQTQQSFNIPKTAPSYNSPILTYRILQQPLEIKSTEKRNTIYKWPAWNIPTGEYDATARVYQTHLRELRQLPLFAETPSKTTEDQTLSSHVGVNREKELSSSHGSSNLELDLELRLGPEPQDSSAAAGLKKFL